MAGCDLLLRRKWVQKMGGLSAIPVVSKEERLAAVKEKFGVHHCFGKRT